MKQAHQFDEKETNLILKKLHAELEEAKNITGKPRRIYNAYKGYILGTGIDNLNRLLTYSLTPAQKTETENLLKAYKEEANTVPWL